jgi:hypothetical protein
MNATETVIESRTEHRGYVITITDWITPVTGYMDRLKLVKAYPEGIKVPSIPDGCDFVPYLIERANTDEDALLMQTKLTALVDMIMDHPEVRNLTIREWNKWLGY